MINLQFNYTHTADIMNDFQTTFCEGGFMRRVCPDNIGEHNTSLAWTQEMVCTYRPAQPSFDDVVTFVPYNAKRVVIFRDSNTLYMTLCSDYPATVTPDDADYSVSHDVDFNTLYDTGILRSNLSGAIAKGGSSWVIPHDMCGERRRIWEEHPESIRKQWPTGLAFKGFAVLNDERPPKDRVGNAAAPAWSILLYDWFYTDRSVIRPFDNPSNMTESLKRRAMAAFGPELISSDLFIVQRLFRFGEAENALRRDFDYLSVFTFNPQQDLMTPSHYPRPWKGEWKESH